jgi:hypothetical protein
MRQMMRMELHLFSHTEGTYNVGLLDYDEETFSPELKALAEVRQLKQWHSKKIAARPRLWQSKSRDPFRYV